MRDLETAIEPGLRIVDAHHHFIAAMDYMPADYRRDLSAGHDVAATVFVEAGQLHDPAVPEAFRPVAETVFAASVAAEAERDPAGPRLCAAIVPHVDLRGGAAVDAVIEAHLAAGGGRVRGIRQSAFWDEGGEVYAFTIARPPRGLLLAPEFRAGFARLAPYGLRYDAVVFHHQLDELTDLAAAFPDTPVVLNHMGFPLGIGRFAGRRREVFDDWRAGLGRLARLPNVSVKVGGLGMPFWGFGFHERAEPASSDELAAAWRPYVEAAIDLFGPQRAMMEANFPPDRRSCGYVTCWNALKKATAAYGGEERRALFAGTAAGFYGIDIP